MDDQRSAAPAGVLRRVRSIKRARAASYNGPASLGWLAEARPSARENRQPPADVRIERIDRLDAQARRMLGELPVALRVSAAAHRARQFATWSACAANPAPAAAARDAAEMRLRISAAALRVNVIARICSG